MTALMLAINKGHLDLVQTLVHGKVDLNKAHPVSHVYRFDSISAIVVLTRVIIIIIINITGDGMACYLLCC